MPELPAKSKSARGPLETPDSAGGSSSLQNSAPPPPHLHGPGLADAALAATLPPTLTPATTTRQSVALGVLSTLWGNTTSAPTTRPPSSATAAERAIPSIVAHAPSPDAQEPPSDLTTSTGSVPSTTTTLTNTLPPIQSAALRALNAPAFQSHASSNSRGKAAKSTSSRTTLSSQPVVVRTYSGSRHTSRPSPGSTTPRPFQTMNGQPPRTSALSAGLAGRADTIPSVDDFSFSAILRAVDPEIRDAIDAIAEICARSRLSLADEYDAHLPPQGEITGGDSGWGAGMAPLIARGRISRIGQGWTAGENTLTAVPEASSSSERLASESGGGTRKTKRSQSAYGSLKSVISGGSGKKKKPIDAKTFTVPEQAQESSQGPSWNVTTSSTAANHPSITLLTSPQASKQLSLDTSSTIKEIHQLVDDGPTQRPQTAVPSQSTHRRQISNTSMPPLRTRSNTLSSFTSWIPWSRGPDVGPSNTPQELTRVEARLREMLMQSQYSTAGKGKASIGVA